MLALAGWALSASAQEPTRDLLIRGGRVIDPRSGVDAVLDVAISGGRVTQVAAGIPEPTAARLVDARGLIVVPGLVDMHAHVFAGTEPDAYLSGSFGALAPDGFTARSCVTTVADAGGAGWRNIRRFWEQIADRSKTRVLAWINIVGSGMRGGPAEQYLGDMDARPTAMRARELPELVVGIKLAHFDGPDWRPVDRAVEAGQLASLPVMVDFGRSDPPLPLEELLLQHLRPGDVLTHAYARADGRIALVDESGALRPFAPEARARGVLFDVGHGAGSFVFGQAVPALRQGFPPDSISTDLHAQSMNAGMKDLVNLMSKFLAMGMSLPDVVRRTTWNPARQMGREDLGHLGAGAVADVAVLGIREGAFGYVDVEGDRLPGGLRLECELTLQGGEVVWDLNGITRPQWRRGGAP
jgi:dihydroorotase